MGQSFELESHRGGPSATASSEDLDVPAAPDARYRDRDTEKELLLQYRDELAVIRRQMGNLDTIPTSEIMVTLSSTAARLREIISDLWDMRAQSASHLRTRHADPLMKDLEFHFRCHSRRLSDLQLDWDMAKGQ